MDFTLVSLSLYFQLANLYVTTLEVHANPSSFMQDNPANSMGWLNKSLEGSCTVVCDANSIAPGGKLNSHETEHKRAPRLAFSAVRNDDFVYVTSRQNRVVLTFDYVLVNHGRAYDSKTSSFSVPQNGIYMLEFTIFKHLNRSPLSVALTVNSNPIFTAFADENNSDREMAHNSGLIGLEVGDIVRVEILQGQLDAGWQKSTFSGFIVYEINY